MLEVGVDGGALTENKLSRFGNFTVTNEIIKALSQVDFYNRYTIYTLDNYQLTLSHNFIFRQLWPRLAWMRFAVSLQELIRPNHIFIALNQAIPLYTRAKIIALSHGLSFMFYPEAYPDSGRRMQQQIKQLIKRATVLIVTSKKIKDSFNDIFEAEKRIKIVTLPLGIPEIYLTKALAFKKKRVLLYVGMAHPIKNIPFLISAFSRFISNKTYQNYKLVLVGVSNTFMKSLKISHQLHNKILNIPWATPKDLLKLYNEASCLLTASLYESFNLPVLEAISQQTQVVGTKNSIIPELQKYVYISKDDTDSFAETIKTAIQTPKKINLPELKKKFSWQVFVEKLINLYAQK